MINTVNKPKQLDDEKQDVLPARIRVDAHDVLPELCDLLASKKRMPRVSYLDATSEAVIEYTKILQRRQQRREQKAVTA